MSAPAPPPAAAASTVSLVEWQHAARLPVRPVSGFLPTKAPISLESVDSALEEGDRYEVSMFMDRQTSASRSARRHEVTISASATVAELKDKLQPLTGVPPELQVLSPCSRGTNPNPRFSLDPSPSPSPGQAIV